MIFSLNDKITVRMFGCVRYERGRWHNGRTLKNHLLLYLTDGTLRMKVAENIYEVTAGDVLLIPSGTLYKPLDSSGCEYYFFHFDAQVREEVKSAPSVVDAPDKNCTGFAYFFGGDGDMTVDLPTHFKPEKKNTTEEILLRAKGLDLSQTPEKKCTLDLYFRELLLSLAQSSGASANMSPTLAKIVRYISGNIRKQINLRIIAENFYLSESYIARLFKRELGKSAVTYITEQKVALAAALLLNTDMPVSEIAEELGFSNQYYFSTVFSKYTGKTPTSFKK